MPEGDMKNQLFHIRMQPCCGSDYKWGCY